MKPSVKSPFDSSMVAALLAATLLWLLVSSASAESVDNARVALLGIGLGIAVVAHMVFLCIALKRDGRAPVLWLVGMLLLPLVMSVVAVVLLVSREDDAERGAGDGG